MNKNKKIICEYWETPVIDSEWLWLYRQLYTNTNNYFFFNKNTDRPEGSIYVLTVRRGSTFKISNEGESASRMHELLKTAPKNDIKWPTTFKVWNSQLAIEACLGLAIPAEEYDVMEKFQYIVLAQDETIEFVTFKEPKWEMYEGIKLDDLVIQYLRKDALD